MRETPSVPRLMRSLRWLLPGGMALVGLGHAVGDYLLEAKGFSYGFWVEVSLFGLLGPGLAWWFLGRAQAAEEKGRLNSLRLARIEAAARAVTSSLDLEEVMRQVCSLAVAQPGVTMAWVGFIEPGSFQVRPAAAAGAPTGYLQDITVTWDDSSTGQGPTGTAVRTGQPQIENDIAEAPQFAPWREAALSRGFHSCMAIPLRVGDQTLGALNLYSGEPGYFSPTVAQGFAIFAGQAAVAIANARLAAENYRRVSLLDELSARLGTELTAPNILQATVNAARELLGAQYAAALLRETPGGPTIHFVSAGWEAPSQLAPPQGRGLFRLALRSGQALRLDDLSEHPLAEGFPVGHPQMRGLLAAPISLRQGQVLGALVLAEKVGMAEFSEKDEQIAQVLARQAAAALDNARMVDELRARAQRLEVTNEVERILGAAVQEEVFPEVVAQLQRLVSFDAAWVVMVDGAKQELMVVAQWSQIPVPVVTRSAFPLSESSAAWVIEHNEPRIAADLAQEHSLATDEFLYSQAGIRSYVRLPLYSRGRVFAVVTLGSQTPGHFGAEALEILQPIAVTAAHALDNAIMLGELQQRSEQLEALSQRLTGHLGELEASQRSLQEAYLGILHTLNLAMESRDAYLRGHSDRDAHFARALARHMGLSDDEVRWIDTAAQFHDIGKLAVPDSILLKPGPLEPAEWAVMYRHPTVAVEMLRFLDFMGPALPLIEGDHERWDGGGYPRGLRSDEIPLGARILAVTDAYDAMTSARPYRSAMNHQRACQILNEGAGTQWDPQVVEAFLAHFGEAPP